MVKRRKCPNFLPKSFPVQRGIQRAEEEFVKSTTDKGNVTGKDRLWDPIAWLNWLQGDKPVGRKETDSLVIAISKKHEVFLLESGCLSGPVTSALSSADLPRTEGEQRPSLSIIGRLFSPHPPFGDVPSVGNNLRPSPIPGNEPPVTAIAAPSSRSRYKRCTCYSYKDKECVYYCHLDVIWINSPERIVPYGLSNVQRYKRSASGDVRRCSCTNSRDRQCGHFCEDHKHKERFLDKGERCT
eukprot:gi/632940003/ref/XP_007883903.1/ PREDICTED: endothelin-3 [Callorhinchus milii]